MTPKLFARAGPRPTVRVCEYSWAYRPPASDICADPKRNLHILCKGQAKLHRRARRSLPAYVLAGAWEGAGLPRAREVLPDENRRAVGRLLLESASWCAAHRASSSMDTSSQALNRSRKLWTPANTKTHRGRHRRAQITGTPAFIVGDVYVGGAQPLSELESAFKQAKKNARP